MSQDDLFKGLITSDDVLGKDVIDSMGRYIGILSVLHIKKDTKALKGISIDTGFMKPSVYVGINKIMNLGIDAIYIKYTPGSRYLDLKVFDKKGGYVGKVIKTDYEGTIVKRIILRSGFHKLVLDVDHISVLGRNIIIDITKEEVEKLNEPKKQ
ncbi:MAG: hypothetical protein ACOCQG_01020 [Candidatus Nanoarchaeia archaeon]